MKPRIFTQALMSVALLLIGVAAQAIPMTNVAPEVRENTRSVRGDFTNDVSAQSASPSIVLFNGHFGAYAVPGTVDTPVVPSGASYELAQSSFGQMVSRDIPTLGFIERALDDARALLYWEFASPPESSAFQYLALLYAPDLTDAGQRVRAQFETMGNLYGDDQRAQAEAAEVILRDALKLAPEDRRLRTALLDLLADRAQAEMILARNARAEAIATRLEPAIPGQRVIDGEIAAFESLLPRFDNALAPYQELLVDPMGVLLSDIDPLASPGTPFGYHMFLTDQPGRSQGAATYLVEGELTPVVGSGEALFAGYRDLVIIFEILYDESINAVELARRLAIRATGTDLDDARELIDTTLQESRELGIIIEGSFPDLNLQPGDASGLAGAIAGWRSGLSQLENLRHFLDGDANILGFSDSFLMLVQNNQGTFDSFDALSLYVDDGPTAPLSRAMTLYQDAITAKDSYRGYQDQYANQHDRLFIRRDDRLFQVTGARFGDPEVDTPQDNVGSEIHLQILSMNAARTRVRRNDQLLANLEQQIINEVERRASEEAINATIADIQIEFGDKRAGVRQVIGGINAAQAFANEITDAVDSDSEFPSGAVAHTVNAFVQAAAEVAKGFLEGDLEQLAAEEQSRITSEQDNLLDLASQITIKNLILEMRLVEIDSLEATLLFQQEVGRLSALYDEANDILAQIERESLALSDRYFADPIHQIRYQEATLGAELAFLEAQRWAFFMARALEFKWNQPFTHSFEGDTWDAGEVFRVRNAGELQQLIAAMRDYDAGIDFSDREQVFFDWFSVREDFFGWQEDQIYVDPVEGDEVDGLTLFRRELTRRVDVNDNIVLEFSTVREIPGGNFFRGPRYDALGNVITPGLYLDKIQWIRISLPGSHSLGRSTLSGQLTQGGVQFVRNAQPGVFDIDNPAAIADEMTSWSTRHWFTLGNNVWQFREALSVPITMTLADDSRVPPAAGEITSFRERSVAATQWRLLIPIEDLGQPVLDLEELDDIELYFFHRAVARQ